MTQEQADSHGRRLLDGMLAGVLVLGLCVFAANFFAGSVGISGWDANYYFSYAAAAAEGDGLVLDDAYRAVRERGGDPEAFGADQRTPTGRLANTYPIGHPMLHTPAVVAAAAVARPLGADAPAHGVVGQMAFCVSAILAAGAGICLMVRVCLYAGLSPAAIAAGLLGLLGCSSLGYYWFVLPALSHTTTLLVAGAASWLAWRILSKPDSGARWWFLLGLVLGWGVTVRLQDAGLAAYGVAVAAAALAAKRPSREFAAKASAGVAGAALGVAPQLAHWRWRTGSWLPREYNDYSYFDFADMHLWEVLLSPRHGLFFWHPWLLLAAVGFVLWMAANRKSPWVWLGAAWVVHFLAIWIIGAGYSIWWFGDSFGSRPFLSVLPLFLVGGAELWRRSEKSRRLRFTLVGVALVLGAWNAALMVAFHLGWISRSGQLNFADVFDGFRNLL